MSKVAAAAAIRDFVRGTTGVSDPSIKRVSVESICEKLLNDFAI